MEFDSELKKRQSLAFWNFICSKFWNKRRDTIFWSYVCEHPNMLWEEIQKIPKSKKDWKRISRNPNITFEIVKAHPECNWDWDLFMILTNPFTLENEVIEDEMLEE